MQILLANPRGFCAGVDRAIDIVERAIDLFGAPIYVRHEVVHNKYVVDRLRTIGAVFVEELNEVPDGATVIFSAHGVSRAIQMEAEHRSLKVFDATCPLVTKVHMEVTRYAREAREVFLIGHAGHPEVEGTIGQFDTSYGGSIYLVETVEDVRSVKVRNAGHLAFVTQTTLSVDDTASIVEALRSAFPGPQGPGQGGHLLRHPEPPGRGQGSDPSLRSAGGGRVAVELEFEPAARDGRQGRHPRLSGRWAGASAPRMVRRRQDRRRDGRRVGPRDPGARASLRSCASGAARWPRSSKGARNT